MPRTKIAITLNEKTLLLLDQLVAKREFPSRSRAIQEALDEKLARITRTRLARECAKLDPATEKRFTEEGIAEELETWPEY